MVSMRKLPRENYRRATWKNGLGHTDEIAIHPEGSDLRRGDFLFRLSSARVAQASPFSTFPDHDRTLVILEGKGLRLTHTYPETGDEETVEVPPLSPYDFPGDVPSRCDLVSGEITDLSLFIRKAEVEAVTEVLHLDGEKPYEWIPAGRWNFVFAADCAVEITEFGTEERWILERGDTLRVELDAPLAEDSPIHIHSKSASGRVIVVGIQA